MTPAQEAAALWGSAQNHAYSELQRLRMALAALEFYGGLAERVEDLADEVDDYNREMARQIRATLSPEEKR